MAIYCMNYSHTEASSAVLFPSRMIAGNDNIIHNYINHIYKISVYACTLQEMIVKF